MPLAWNEIRQRAIAFSREWGEAARERSESQSFWNDFFHVFGKSRKMVATFEEPVKNLGGHTDWIDVFWKGRMIGESKSRGKDLGLAASQANNYAQNLINDGREDEVPRWIVTTDFEFMVVHDLERRGRRPRTSTHRFRVRDLHREVRRFGFIAGYQTRRLDPEDPANLKAAALLANLHDRLEDGGYTGHDLQVFMVRVLFCLFAEDTEALPRDALKRFVQHHTRDDGSDLGSQLAQFFQTLDTPHDKRQANLLEELAELPYVNGSLFGEQLRFASFNAAMRVALLQCSHFRWEEISPAIFGSLFQGIMKPRKRRDLGAHYTSERDILKLIRSLFLDRLREEFRKLRTGPKLAAFHDKLAGLKFLDPACGCGNFLLIAYRELRQLELEVLLKLHPVTEQRGLDFRVRDLLKVNVDQFFGIEIEEWPARIAEVAMWLLDHQMNVAASEAFGQLVARFPLTARPGILHGNALTTDWNEVLPAEECSYVLGNPPFLGKKERKKTQPAEHADVWKELGGAFALDYVTCWYKLAADYVEAGKRGAAFGFVSTNSITQGEQVGILWPYLFKRGLEIAFGHRGFPWTSDATGKAHVHVVIVGLAARGTTDESTSTTTTRRGTFSVWLRRPRSVPT